MGDVDPRTCPTCVNRVKHEEPSNVMFNLIFIYFVSWLCWQNLTPDLRDTARWRTVQIMITSQASVPKFTSHPQQFVCPLSLDCSFWSSSFYFVTMTTVSKWVAHISHSLSSFIFFFYFPCSDFHLSVFSTHSPTLSCTITATLSFPLFRLTPNFFLFLTTVIYGTDLCSVFFTTVCYKIFMLHSNISTIEFQCWGASGFFSPSWHSVCLKLQPGWQRSISKRFKKSVCNRLNIKYIT